MDYSENYYLFIINIQIPIQISLHYSGRGDKINSGAYYASQKGGISMARTVKRLLILTALAVLTVFSSGCGAKEDYPWGVHKSDIAVAAGQEIGVKMQEGSLTKTGAEFIVFNSGEEDIYLGVEFFLQIYDGGDWCDIEGNAVDWTLEQMFITPGGEAPQVVSWDNMYGELPEGRYRFVKSVAIGDSNEHYACEFEIKD